MRILLLVALLFVVVLCLLDTSNAWGRRRRRRRHPAPPPKIDCVVSSWRSWGPCSRTCGSGGRKSRNRIITRQPKNGGRGCPSLYHTVGCFNRKCPVDCKWSAWGSWSECDSCSTGRSRFRNVSEAAMFGGQLCSGSDFEVSRSCPTPNVCPVDCPTGYFNCSDGLTCIRSSLRCNGDDDCTDNSDEHCEEKTSPCGSKTLSVIPNIYLAGAGFDITDGMTAGQILDNHRYNGRCGTVYSGDHFKTFRKPANIQFYTFQVRVDSSFRVNSYESAKEYVDKQKRETEKKISVSASYGIPLFAKMSIKSSFSNNKVTRQVIKESSNKYAKYFKVTSTVKLAQFSIVTGNTILTHNFRRRLHELPDHYDYQKYLRVIFDYGTHFYSSGILGGKYEYIYRYSKSDLQRSGLSESDQKKCISLEASAKFFGAKTSTGSTHCSSNALSKYNGNSFTKAAKEEISMVSGGDSSTAAQLSFNREPNQRVYQAWVETVKRNPSIIEYGLTPISDVITDRAKKSNMERALFHYMAKYDDKVCKRKCDNGETAVVTDAGESCTCL